jgi:hypothetical protein
MEGFQQFTTEEDLVELSKQGYFTIMLDENLRVLEAALEDDGFKVVVPYQGLKDEALKRQARGWAILTKNSQDFIDEAVRYDYDVIGIEDIKFVAGKTDWTNETVRKISNAVRRSQLGTRKGNFWLKIRDNGSFHLEQLV